MKINYVLAKFFMKTIGQSSDGLRLCFKYGLTSGKMLDYVYRNQPQGRFLIGRWIDQVFLSNPGWEAVRARRQNLEGLVIEAIDGLRKAKQNVLLLDIASGPADYILSVLEKAGGKDILARCQDYDARWVEEGRQKARARKLNNVEFNQGDAFDRQALLGLSPRPNLVVSSGFYDWFVDDMKIIESIRIVFDMLSPGGYFVLSNQMDHPDLEFTQSVFVDFDGKPLRMTMRSKEKVSRWLEEAGFIVEKTLADTHGYYSVTKAQKP